MIFSVPHEGTFVSKYQVKSAGPYLLGPTFGFSPVSSIVQCLARKKETDKFFTLKVKDIELSMVTLQYLLDLY